MSMAQIQSVDLCYNWKECRNSHIHSILPGTSTLQLFQMPSHSWQSSCGGSSWSTWAFRITWGFSDCKKNKFDPKKCLGKAGLVCWSLKTVFWRITPTQIGTLIISLVLLKVLSENNSSWSFCPLHHCSLYTTFSRVLLLLTQRCLFSCNYTNLSSSQGCFMSAATSSKWFHLLISII